MSDRIGDVPPGDTAHEPSENGKETHHKKNNLKAKKPCRSVNQAFFEREMATLLDDMNFGFGGSYW